MCAIHFIFLTWSWLQTTLSPQRNRFSFWHQCLHVYLPCLSVQQAAYSDCKASTLWLQVGKHPALCVFSLRSPSSLISHLLPNENNKVSCKESLWTEWFHLFTNQGILHEGTTPNKSDCFFPQITGLQRRGGWWWNLSPERKQEKVIGGGREKGR